MNQTLQRIEYVCIIRFNVYDLADKHTKKLLKSCKIHRRVKARCAVFETRLCVVLLCECLAWADLSCKIHRRVKARCAVFETRLCVILLCECLAWADFVC